MSFAKVISLISTMTPTGIGFFGYTWEILGNFFVYIFTYVVNAFYGVCKWFLAFVDFLQYFIQKLIGLDYWLSPGGKDLKGATESDLLFSFLYNETVQDVFRALVGLFIVFLIIFTVFAIIKQEWKFVTGTEKDNTKGKILSGSLKAIALVIITPLILVIGIISSNAILASIVKALNIDMSTTFGNTIFSIASVNANKYRIYTDSGDRTPVSQQVTFYINSNKELVLYGSAASDEYQKVYDDYDEYLAAINSADKYTVDSMFPIVVPSDHDEFYGYCISLNINGNLEYFMVEVDVDNANSAESKEKILAMYYYLRNVLRANIMSKNNNIGSADILKALGGDISSAASSTPCLISKFDLDGCKEDAVYEACYNTWDYATIYRTETAFEATTASTLVMNLNDYYINGQSNAKIVYNAYDYQKYFDGGQFGFVGLNAEYGVMTDVIDFICETGANLYILDATSSLINWNYEGYQIEGKWVSEITGGAPTMYNAYGEEYLPFIVDYSETAMDHEEGKTLYFAKANVSNELEGSKFIMCWKVSTESGIKYVPLLNRETFTDPVTKQTYTFKSTYLSNSYKGLVVAKGNFDQSITSSVNGPDNGDPTYFKVGASLGEGEDAIEYTNEPYYYDIAESGELVQYVSGLDISTHAQNQMTLKNINFDNSSFPNYALVFDSIDKALFRFVDTNTNAEVDITTNLISSLTIRFVDSSNKSDSAIYAGVNDGTNYLFVSSSTGRVLMLSLTDSRTLTVRGVGEDGSISASRVVPSEIDVSVNTFNSPSFLYKITLNYDNGYDTDTYSIKPLDLQFSETADGKSLFSSIEKYYIVMNGSSTGIKQNMTLCAYFNESSLYNIVDGKLEMATFSASNKYTLQMFRVSLYDFMVGYVNGDVCKYIASNSAGNRVVATNNNDIVESFDFGVVVDGFEWLEDKTEYSVFNGSSYVAKLLKTKGATFTIDDIAGSDSKTIGIEVDGNRYYNVKTQNKYNDDDAMEAAYDIINNSMFVGCYRDRATTDFLSCDFHFSLVGNFRFKLKLNLPVLENEQLMNKNYGVFSLTDGIAFDYFFEGDNSLVQFYNSYKVAYWIILIASALIIKTLGTALWGVIKRFYEVTLYYLAMPIAASTMPLDGGKKFGQIQEGLIKNVLGAYGVILGINMFFILLSPVKSLSNIFTQAEMDSSTSYFLRHFPFGAKVLNNYVYILFVLVAFTMIDTLPSVINGLVGGKDVVAEGKTTKENVGKSIKSAGDMISGKSAMDFAGKTVNALSQTPMAAPIKWAAGKVKGGVDSVIGSFNRGASQEDDDAAQKGGDKQKSSRADGSDETQTTSQETGEAAEATEANETTEMQNTNSRADGEANDGEESNAADESQEADVAAEFNKEQANAELGEEGKVDAIKEAAENGEKQEVTNAIASNIVGDKETITKDNAADFGLDENAVREIVRQMLGEQGKNMSDEELDNYSIALNRDLMGNVTGSTLKKKGEDGTVEDVKEVDADKTNQAIVANASNEKVKEAYSNLNEDQKDMVDSAIAVEASGVSFTEEKHKEATEEQKTEAIKDMAKSDENQEVSNAVASEVVSQKMDELAQQNKNEPEVKSVELDEEYAASIGEKLEAGKTISAEEAGITAEDAQMLKDIALGEDGEKLSDEELAKYKLEFTKDENGVVSAKVTAPEEDKTKSTSTIDAAMVLSEEQIRQIIAEILGEKATEEQIAKSKLEFTRDENGVVSAKVTAPEETAENQEIKLDDKQMAAVNSKILENASDEEVKDAYQNLGSDVKAKVDSYASENFAAKEVTNVAPENATLANASVNALKVIDKYKDDEDVENAVILKTLEADPEKMKSFMYESGLSDNASKDEKLEVIAQMKNSQNANAASMALKDINEKGLTDAHAQVVAEMMADGKIKTSAWDLASESEKQEFRQQQKQKNHEFNDEEKAVEKELNMQAVHDYENEDKADYDRRIIEAYLNDDSIEGKSAITTNLLLKASGLDNKKSVAYAEAAKVIASAKFSYGNKKINLQEIAKKGYSEFDVLAAYKKIEILQKNGKIGSDKVLNKDKSLNADLLMKMLENPNENTDDALSKMTEKDTSARKTVSDMLMKGTNGSTPLLTSEQQDGLVSKIAEGDGNGFTFIAKQLGKANNGKDERGTAYNMVIDEAVKRKQVEKVYATQSALINADMLNKLAGTDNYNALLAQINDMKTKAGESTVASINDNDLQKLINNEDNLGYDPIELENLKKEIIKQKIKNPGFQDLTEVVDASKLSGKEKDNFEYRKTIIEDQVKAEGDNSETLANLFKNSNFVGKDELQKTIEAIVNGMKLNSDFNGKSNDELYALAVGQVLKSKTEAEIQTEIKNYANANGVDEKEAEQVVRQRTEQAENTRNLLYSIGASDITKAISEDNLKDKQKDTIKSDVVLSRMLADAGIKETDSDYDAKLQAFMASNAAFAGRLNEKVQNMIDPSKQVSAEDKDRFFKSKSQEDLTTNKFGPITEGIKAKNKTRKHLPKESKKYDEWNELIDKDMDAVKSGKGAYKNLSKEDRKAKLDELKSKKINTERPEDYYDWDYTKQKEYDDNQNILKNEALNTNISKVKKKDIKAFKPKDKNVILKFADATGDKLSDIPVLRAVSSKFASDDLKAKHNKELLLEEEKIARFNSSAPMRKRSEDFGSNFENFAKSYISKKSIDRIQKDVASKGLTGEAAIKAREEAFAKQLNKNYKVASAKVARDNRVDKNEFLVEKGINAGNVRYKDGTKKYTEVKSRLGRRTAKIVQKYEKEYASGNVSEKTRKKYEKSKFANRSEEAAIKVQNQQKLYDQVVEFNRSYKRGDGDYADLFKKKFGDELYKKYNTAGIRDLEKSPAIVQQRELLKRIENELKKNINRQKFSAYIPAADKAKDRFRADTLTNAKTKAAVEHDRQMMAHFNNAMKQFKAQTAGGKTINPDEFLKSINPAVLGKHLQDFKGVDNEFIKNYLEKGFEKYRKRVVNNSFTPSQLQNLVKLNGTYVDKSKVDRSRISNTVLKSLRASDAEVYKNIVKSVNSARAKADNEAANLDSLKQALRSAQSGVQNNAAKAEAEKIRKAIANSEIKLNNLKGVLGAEEARKKAFEQAIASDRIKKAIRENIKSAPAASSKPHDYSKPDGSPRIIKPGSLDHRQVQKLERNFMANARAELENMAKIIASKESQKLVDEINKTRRDLSYDARENVKQLKALQLKIKKELKTLVDKNDKKTKRYQDELKMQNAKIDSTIKKMSEEFAKMDIII